ENDPAHHGPGNGFLLLVDSTPQEFAYPGVPARYFRDDDGWRRYEFDADAQPWLRQAYLDVMCFQRRADYYPVDLSDEDRAACDKAGTPPGENVSWSDRQLLFGYTLINELLPGA